MSLRLSDIHHDYENTTIQIYWKFYKKKKKKKNSDIFHISAQNHRLLVVVRIA